MAFQEVLDKQSIESCIIKLLLRGELAANCQVSIVHRFPVADMFFILKLRKSRKCEEKRHYYE